jgi:hypothetical protein
MKAEEHLNIDRELLRAARIISWVFTPFSIPFLAMLALFLFSHLRIMPIQYKVIVLTLIYCFTILMPTIMIYVFRKISGFNLLEIGERRKRYIPLLLTILSYLFCLIVMRRLNIPWYMSGIILSCLISLIVSVIVNTFWKLSEHMIGIGEAIGGIISFGVLFGYNPLLPLCGLLFIGGILGSARIILGHHTLSEVLGGFFLGYFSILIVLHPMTNRLFRYFLL